MQIGDTMTLHKLANSRFDGRFKTVNGRVEYESIDYPNRASGWWCIVSRSALIDGRWTVITRRLHTDTMVTITEVFQ